MADNINNRVLKAGALFGAGHYDEAFCLYEEGMKAGDTRAIFNYAYCLQCGYGTPADPARAFKLYEYIRNEEDGDAAYNAAAMLLTGRGVPCDPQAGYERMLLAADLGCIEAQLYIAMVRLTGCVGEPDIQSIRRIPFHKPDGPQTVVLLPPSAAEEGTLTQDLIDRRFEIVAADEYEALRYMKMAAEHDGDYTGASVGDAELLLAKAAEEGLGEEFSYEKSVELYVRAALHGNAAARRKVATLPRADVESAQRTLRIRAANERRRLLGETPRNEG